MSTESQSGLPELRAIAPLRENWYFRSGMDGVDLLCAGIYQWHIQGVGLYVGKAKVLRSRLAAYPNNVRRMLAGLSWHRDPKRDYRVIHYALRDAYRDAIPVELSVLETCDAALRSEREQLWITKRLIEATAGGPKVLNGLMALRGSTRPAPHG